MSKTTKISVDVVAKQAVADSKSITFHSQKLHKNNTKTMYFSAGLKSVKTGKIHPLMIEAKNIVVTRGVADPNDATDKRNEHDGMRMRLQTSISKSGAFGVFAKIAQTEWTKFIDEQTEKKVFSLKGRTIKDLVMLAYPEDHKDVEKRNQPIADPGLQFKIVFAKRSPTFYIKSLANKQTTMFYDGTRPLLDEQGERVLDDFGLPAYHPATVAVNGEDQPITADNLHYLLTAGTELAECIVDMTSVVITQAWVTWPPVLIRAVVLPNKGGKFASVDDDFDDTPTNHTTTTTDTTAENIAAALEGLDLGADF